MPTETYLLPKPLKGDVDLSICWAYPNAYNIGMAGLGYQLIWRIIDQDPNTLVKRWFTDFQDNGWETAELIGFTLSWELDYTNVLAMLKSAGLPWLSKDRQNGDALVFGGGPSLAANPEPFADFFDVVLIGDAEVTIPAFIQKWKQIRNQGDRLAKLRALSQVDGLYVPSLYRYVLPESNGPIGAIEPIYDDVPPSVKRQQFTAPPEYVAHSFVLTPDTTWGDMFLAEIVRSCPQECRFCLASFLTRPFRGVDVDALMDKVDLALNYTAKIGLLGPSVTEHPRFAEIAQRLLERPQINISVASIRADTIDPVILNMLVKLHQKSVTIALESGSERLRQIMKKNLTEEEILSAMQMIAASGLSGVKLYGIVGLPEETQFDLDETVRLLTLLKKTHKNLRITFGVSSFVPKAQTPFQWHGRDRQSGQKLEFVRKRLAKTGIDVRPESHNWSDIQTLLSRGDRRLTPVLIAVAESSANLGAWKKALKERPQGCPDENFYIHRNIPYDETLPWSHLMETAKAGMLYKHSTAAEQIAVSFAPKSS